jgi:DNA-binding transcriptional LysR family regulator
MDLNQARYFLTIVANDSFTRAADELGISQPALTKSIRKLEAELGGPLFYREGKRLLLSELGELVRPRFAAAIEGLQAAADIADSYRLLRKAPLKVGVMSTIGPLRLSPFLAMFESKHPGVELELYIGDLEVTWRRLEQSEVDLAIMSAPGGLNDRCNTQPLYDEHYAVIFPPGHRFATLEVVRLADVSGERYVDRLSCELRELVTAMCQQHDIDLYASFRSERDDWVQAMVAAGLGFAFMPECAITHHGVLARPLVEPRVTRTVELARMRGRRLSPAARAFVSAACAMTETAPAPQPA